MSEPTNPPPPAPPPATVAPGANAALALLLAINLFNYIDRQVLSAVLPKLQLDANIFSPTDPQLKFKLGLLTTAFLVSYMLISPVFGVLGDKRSRWLLVGIGVILWSLASGGSGLATSFAVLLATRCLVGIGEAAYGPVAPSMISDLYPVERRGQVLSWFYMAIPVGSALGFVLGGAIADTAWGWRGAFLVTLFPGLLLVAVCFFMREPPRRHAQSHHGSWADYKKVIAGLFRTPSYRYCTFGMTASTFLLGGVAAWMPFYIFEREARFALTPAALEKLAGRTFSDGSPAVPTTVVEKLRTVQGDEVLSAAGVKQKLTGVLTETEREQYLSYVFDAAPTADSPTTGSIGLIFGAIVVLSGLGATLLGGIAGDRLRGRYPGSYFLVAGWGMFVSFPLFLLVLVAPFPWAWVLIFLAVFGLFFNTGPTNTVLANVTHPSVRATGFAVNILIIHLLGDAISPPLIGLIADYSSLDVAFAVVSVLILVGGVLWLMGARHLKADTDRANAL